VRGRAGAGQAAGRPRYAALADVLRGGEEETEGSLFRLWLRLLHVMLDVILIIFLVVFAVA
jgi:hypothetical protein